jgi:hypothetical protein
LKSSDEVIVALVFGDKWLVEREGSSGNEAIGNQQSMAQPITLQQVDGGVRNWLGQFDDLKPFQEAIEGALFGFVLAAYQQFHLSNDTDR